VSTKKAQVSIEDVLKIVEERERIDNDLHLANLADDEKQCLRLVDEKAQVEKDWYSLPREVRNDYAQQRQQAADAHRQARLDRDGGVVQPMRVVTTG